VGDDSPCLLKELGIGCTCICPSDGAVCFERDCPACDELDSEEHCIHCNCEDCWHLGGVFIDG
jgi:hypothetical protein